MGTRVVKNYPSPRLMETIGATNQTPPEAIGELVANCFDARCGNEKLTITIDMCGGQVAVIDDGKGMTAEILEKAVCIAEDISRRSTISTGCLFCCKSTDENNQGYGSVAADTGRR